ncbi:hypothetical protein [Sphingomonas sp. PR090111-T3T-6A]|uniref:hypothetical protein n=1 Tax=Sphingomonas sp. PR090111-T3T-6A TaxID=685778 RepID=UPI00036A30E0|nr:hypothetical protein [Sphingomonas sp. PR090111-T3T-6A]
MAKTIFIQTADPFNYRKMLDATSRTVVEFCRRHDHGYESFIGIKRGSHPWQATFNRIPMLTDLVKRGQKGWVVYLDADAYIFDLDFDLRSYLADKADRAAVMVSMGGEPHWAVNAGVFMLNLGHEAGRRIVERWAAKFAALSDEQLVAMTTWDDGCSDQSMLYEVLDEDVLVRNAVHYESNELINGNYSRFIRQILRAYYPSLEARIEALRVATNEVLPGGNEFVADVAPVIVSAFYRTILRRDPDQGGLEHFVSRFREVGIDIGTRDTLSAMLGSPEYRSMMQE